MRFHNQFLLQGCIVVVLSCILYSFPSLRSRDSSVGIATRYVLEGPGIESRWVQIFLTYPDRLRGPPSLLYNGYRVFPGGKGGRGMMLTTHPLLVPRLRKSWAIPPLTLWVLLGLLRGSLFTLPSLRTLLVSSRVAEDVCLTVNVLYAVHALPCYWIWHTERTLKYTRPPAIHDSLSIWFGVV
jgi:hypothetical protein